MDNEWEDESAQGPGARLAEAREARGMTVENVAFELRLSVQLIHSLERDAPDPKLNKTFVRGYLRSYARCVGLSPNDIILNFERTVEPIAYPQPEPLVDELPATPTSFERLMAFYGAHQRPLVVGLGSTIAAVLLAVLVMLMPHSPDKINLSSVTEFDEGPTEVVSAREAPIQAILGRLELSFTEECWVTIFDGEHARLVTGIQSPGQPLRLEGRPPFQVMLGNPKGADLRYNGASVNMTKARDETGIVNLTLG